jgi:hypothetical protein
LFPWKHNYSFSRGEKFKSINPQSNKQTVDKKALIFGFTSVFLYRIGFDLAPIFSQPVVYPMQEVRYGGIGGKRIGPILKWGGDLSNHFRIFIGKIE